MMSDMFNSVYDEIFFDKEVVSIDDNSLADITRRYLNSSANASDKKFFLNLRKEYLTVKGVKDYKTKQQKLYENKTRKEIVLFEVARIKNNNGFNSYYSDKVATIIKTLELNSEMISDQLYKSIVDEVIKMEISLGIKIGLFEELCNLFHDEVSNIEAYLANGSIRRANGK